MGHPQIECKDPGCSRDPECLDTEACYDGSCVPPCLVDDPCGANAECYNRGHRANCRCREGFEGEPTVGCTPIGCRSDEECPNKKACYK